MVAAIVMLYPMETNKIVKHGDNIHVICHFHSEHFMYLHIFFRLIPKITYVSPRNVPFSEDEYTWDNKILNRSEIAWCRITTTINQTDIHINIECE